MNTRGIVQLVVLNIGVQLNVLSPIIFAIFVLMATILTFLTSPLLFILFRKGADPRKLSMNNIVDELELTKDIAASTTGAEGEEIQTVSNGDMGMENEEKRATPILPRPTSMNLPAYETLMTIDERLNYPEIDPNTHFPQPSVIANIVTMPVCPTIATRRSLNMTRF